MTPSQLHRKIWRYKCVSSYKHAFMHMCVHACAPRWVIKLGLFSAPSERVAAHCENLTNAGPLSWITCKAQVHHSSPNPAHRIGKKASATGRKKSTCRARRIATATTLPAVHLLWQRRSLRTGMQRVHGIIQARRKKNGTFHAEHHFQCRLILSLNRQGARRGWMPDSKQRPDTVDPRLHPLRTPMRWQHTQVHSVPSDDVRVFPCTACDQTSAHSGMDSQCQRSSWKTVLIPVEGRMQSSQPLQTASLPTEWLGCSRGGMFFGRMQTAEPCWKKRVAFAGMHVPSQCLGLLARFDVRYRPSVRREYALFGICL